MSSRRFRIDEVLRINVNSLMLNFEFSCLMYLFNEFNALNYRLIFNCIDHCHFIAFLFVIHIRSYGIRIVLKEILVKLFRFYGGFKFQLSHY